MLCIDSRLFWINPVELKGIPKEASRTRETPFKLVELYEDHYSEAEELIVRRWMVDAPKEPKAHKFAAFLGPLLDKIKNPQRLYVNHTMRDRVGVEKLVQWYVAYAENRGGEDSNEAARGEQLMT